MAEWVTCILGALLAIIALLYKYLTWHFAHWKKLGVAGPKPSPLFGNFPSIYTGKQHVCYDFDAIYRDFKQSKRVVGVFGSRTPELMITDPQLAHDIMVTNFRSFHDNLSSIWVAPRSKDRVAARNPFFIRGDEWKAKRSETIGGLTQSRLNLATPIWQGAAKKLTAYLNEQTAETGSVQLEAKNLAYRFTLAIMCDFLWGIDASTFTDSATGTPNAVMQQARKMLLHSLETVGMHFFLNVAPFLKRFFNLRFFPEETDQFFSHITRDAIAMRQKQPENSERADFLNYVMQLQEKKGITFDDATGHLMTALLDGYETASIVIYHMLFYLAHHQAAQQRLREELLQSAGLSLEELDRLSFLDQCVHETLRLVTPIPLFARICTQPIKLPVDSDRHITVQPGTLVNIPIFSYHHDEEFFPQPYEFKPERFDHVKHADLTKRGIFMPFGDGPRICLGMRTGLFEVKTCIVEVLRNYRVKCCSRTMLEKRPDALAFVLGLDGDFWLEFERL